MVVSMVTNHVTAYNYTLRAAGLRVRFDMYARYVPVAVYIPLPAEPSALHQQLPAAPPA